jgi:hypothetical protein
MRNLGSYFEVDLLGLLLFLLLLFLARKISCLIGLFLGIGLLYFFGVLAHLFNFLEGFFILLVLEGITVYFLTLPDLNPIFIEEFLSE